MHDLGKSDSFQRKIERQNKDLDRSPDSGREDRALPTPKGYDMHVLIIGAAGMVGRKLTDRLVADKRLGGRDLTRFTLVDVVEPAVPADFSGKTSALTVDLSAPGA